MNTKFDRVFWHILISLANALLWSISIGIIVYLISPDMAKASAIWTFLGGFALTFTAIQICAGGGE